MPRQQLDHDPTIHEFQEWANKRRVPNETALQDFIPISEVQAFFHSPGKTSELLKVLFDEEESRPRSQTVRNYYILVFCILIAIGRGRQIQHFLRHDHLQDSKLPFFQKPEHFGHDSTCSPDDFFEDFERMQWRFCVPVLDRERTFRDFDHRTIMPFLKKQRIGGGGSATVYQVEVHRDHDRLEARVGLRPLLLFCERG